MKIIIFIHIKTLFKNNAISFANGNYKTIFQDNRSVADHNKHQNIDDAGSLVIANASEEDSGNYECRVTQDGIIQESIDLEILQMNIIDKQEQASISLTPGDNATFDCKIEVSL